jgi:hypothetical protein
MLKSLFVNDLSTKLMALGLAVVVWFFLDQQAVQEITLTEVRLTVLAPRGVAVLRVTPAGRKDERLDGPGGGFLRVTLRGEKGLLGSARRGLEGRHILADVKDVSSSAVTVLRSALRPSDFDLPRGIEVTRIDPSDVDIEVAQESARHLRIADDVKDCLTGAPPSGLEVAGIRFNPTHVRVRGLRHVLDHIQAIPIVPVDVSDRTASFAQRVQIQGLALGTPVTTDEPIEMAVTLRPREETRALPGLRVDLLVPEPGGAARDRVRLAGPATVTAHVRGPAAAVEAVATGRRIRVFADAAAAGSAAGRATCPLRAFIDGPEAALVQVTLDPAQATVETEP